MSTAITVVSDTLSKLEDKINKASTYKTIENEVQKLSGG